MKYLPEPQEPLTRILAYDGTTGQIWQQSVASSGAQGAQGAQGTTGAQGSPGAGGGISITSPSNNRVLSCIDNAGSSALAEADLTFTPSSGFGTQNWLDVDNGGLSFEDGIAYLGAGSLEVSYTSTTTFLTIPTSGYRAVFVDFTIYNSAFSKMKSGTMVAHWNSSTVTTTTYGVTEIGGTGLNYTLSGTISGGNALMRLYNGVAFDTVRLVYQYRLLTSQAFT